MTFILLAPPRDQLPKMPAVRNESIVDTQQEETQVSDGQELDVPQAAPTSSNYSLIE